MVHGWLLVFNRLSWIRVQIVSAKNQTLGKTRLREINTLHRFGVADQVLIIHGDYFTIQVRIYQS